MRGLHSTEIITNISVTGVGDSVTWGQQIGAAGKLSPLLIRLLPPCQLDVSTSRRCHYPFIVQDNCTIHKSKSVQAAWHRWRAEGLFVLFLPPYCSELNPIERQWHQLKTHELAGRMFEYEDELTEAIVHGMIDRSVRGDYELDCLIINYS